MDKERHQRNVTDRDIKALYDRERAEMRASPFTHRLAHRVARFSGTVVFIGTHCVLFIAWIVFNVFWKVDPYPFTFLTMLVSLESIFLSSFVMLSQNELTNQAERRHTLDLQVNLLSEMETTAIAKVLIKIGKRLGMSLADLAELQELSADTDPEEMLENIIENEQDVP